MGFPYGGAELWRLPYPLNIRSTSGSRCERSDVISSSRGNMTVPDLKKALTEGTPRSAVVVSMRLFEDLYEAAELRPRRQKIAAPRDPACRKVLDTWLKIEGLPSSDNLTAITWHLASHAGVRIVRDKDLFMTLRERGPNSFEFI